MKSTLFGLFNDSKKAGLAVNELKEKGYTKEISLLAYDKKHDQNKVSKIKEDITTGTATGATLGAITGALAGVFSGISSIVVTGIGILVGGPLVATLGVTGGVIGSLGGGLLGALIDLGINEPAAALYEKEIKKGQVLVGVSTDEKTQDEVRTILNTYGANDITTNY